MFIKRVFEKNPRFFWWMCEKYVNSTDFVLFFKLISRNFQFYFGLNFQYFGKFVHLAAAIVQFFQSYNGFLHFLFEEFDKTFLQQSSTL